MVQLYSPLIDKCVHLLYVTCSAKPQACELRKLNSKLFVFYHKEITYAFFYRARTQID